MHSIAISIKGLSMKIILFLVAMLVITSCQPPQPVVTGGSRADGLVEAKWTDVGLNLYEPDFSLTDADANIRCQAWGYAEAMPFAGYEQVCAEGDAEWMQSLGKYQNLSMCW